ncbi:MAG: hypothetical protein AAGB34_03510 [Planctomycetota bacterium]
MSESPDSIPPGHGYHAVTRIAWKLRLEFPESRELLRSIRRSREFRQIHWRRLPYWTAVLVALVFLAELSIGSWREFPYAIYVVIYAIASVISERRALERMAEEWLREKRCIYCGYNLSEQLRITDDAGMLCPECGKTARIKPYTDVLKTQRAKDGV